MFTLGFLKKCRRIDRLVKIALIAISITLLLCGVFIMKDSSYNSGYKKGVSDGAEDMYFLLLDTMIYIMDKSVQDTTVARVKFEMYNDTIVYDLRPTHLINE